ncbi:hypothetical protein [Brevibacillus borstelensis]|uniref:hypothetical protein n=1 Tax=Brevibacillus borstelensis TaxID=45462 RepID=UPI0030C4E580
MLYVVGGLLVLVGLAWCLSGSISLKKRDEYATKHSMDDSIAHQTLSQMHNQQHF